MALLSQMSFRSSLRLFHSFTFVSPCFTFSTNNLRLKHPLAFILITFSRRRKEMEEFYSTNNSISRGHYFRLIAIASFDLLLTFPTGIMNMVLDIVVELENHLNLRSYHSWAYAHQYIHIINTSDSSWRASHINLIVQYYNWWRGIVYPFLFFFLFGTTTKMRGRYKNFFWICVKPLGLVPSMKLEAAKVEMKFAEVIGPVTQESRRWVISMFYAHD